ncbi:MAG TPA: hypothetical protein VHE30_17860 [Polyangiaceae bacterium]|nr:hypothetical protein [Polyangiaceae bacterium]
MESERDEWVRLPGLFRWEEVSEVFALASGFDDEWQFDVRAVPSDGEETLYVVRAALTGSLTSERAEHISGIIPIPGARMRVSKTG